MYQESLNGIFDTLELTGTQLLLLCTGLLALFLYVVLRPLFLRRELQEDEGMMRQRVADIKRIYAMEDATKAQRAWARWALDTVTAFAKRHNVHIEYLGLAKAEQVLIAYDLDEHDLPRPAATARPPAPTPASVSIDQIPEAEPDLLVLEDEPAVPTPKRPVSVPPEVPAWLRKVPSLPPNPIIPSELREDAPREATGSGTAAAMATEKVTNGGSSRERRKRRRAARRSTSERSKS